MSPTGREVIALRPPHRPHDLSDFPHRDIPAGSLWHREHAQALGPWWFASDDGGRFNLDAPRGTLYVAATAEAAVLERVGGDLVKGGFIPAALADERVVSALRMPIPIVLADVTHAEVIRWGVVATELCTVANYTLTRAWAHAFDEAGFDGLWAMLRFSGPAGRGLAVFGEAGERSWPADPEPAPVRMIIAKMGLTVLDPPVPMEVTVLRP